MLKPEWFDDWFYKTFGDKDVYSPLEIAQALKISKNLVYDAIKRAELEGIQVGKRLCIIPKKALINWLIENYILNIEM